jgi:hypothetical protein
MYTEELVSGVVGWSRSANGIGAPRVDGRLAMIQRASMMMKTVRKIKARGRWARRRLRKWPRMSIVDAKTLRLGEVLLRLRRKAYAATLN